MNTRKSILLLVVCLFLCGGLFVTLHLLDQTELMEQVHEEEQEQQRPYVTVYTSTSPLDEIHLKNTISHYTLLRGVDSDAQEFFIITGMEEDIPLYGGLIASYFSGGNVLNAYDVIEDAGDLAPFGLDKPSEIQFFFTDGTTTTLLIGGMAYDGSSVYVMASGDNLAGEEGWVYLTDLNAIQHYLQGPMDFIYPVITDVSVRGSVFDTVTISGGNREEPIVIRRSMAPDSDDPESTMTNYTITAPVNRPMDLSRGLTALQSLFGITANDTAAVNPDDSTLAMYGLINPHATVTVNGAEQGDFTLFASQPDADGLVYLMREDIPVIYQVAKSAVPWVDMDVYDFMAKNALSPSIGDVSAVEVVVGTVAYHFSLTGEGEALAATLDDAELPLARFRPYYQTLAGAAIAGYNANALPGTELLKVTFHYRAGGSDTLTFSTGEAGSRVLTLEDGATGFLVNSDYVECVIRDAAALKAGRDVTPYQE